MFPYKTSLQLNRNNKQALYLQLANQFINLIKEQKLPPKTKLPSSRSLAELLKIHRKTVVACYDELILQGWFDSIPKKGTYVNAKLPEFIHQDYKNFRENQTTSNSGFSFYINPILKRKAIKNEGGFLYINDGISDARLTPTEDLARIYRRICGRKNIYREMSYTSLFGVEKLRKTLSIYLNKTRGLNTSYQNILITRGSQMGIYLSSKLLITKDDVIVVGETNYASADTTFLNQKAKLIRVKVDEFGLVTKHIEALCYQQKIKAVYVTSHHHHPTTVTLSAERRIHLLNLAKEFNFAIIEDDYDYDFNYNHSPILPLASHDTNNNVIYIGSVCKTVAPVFRIGYLIAAEDVVNEAANQRRFIDRQGDALLELTFEEFIKSGDLDRHINKVMKVYKERRDLFCAQLNKHFSDVFSFDIPKGGMAVWVRLNANYSWQTISDVARKHKLEIGEWKRYDNASIGHNSIRIGFASYNKEEIYELIRKLHLTFDEIEN